MADTVEETVVPRERAGRRREDGTRSRNPHVREERGEAEAEAEAEEEEDMQACRIEKT